MCVGSRAGEHASVSASRCAAGLLGVTGGAGAAGRGDLCPAGPLGGTAWLLHGVSVSGAGTPAIGPGLRIRAMPRRLWMPRPGGRMTP
jgi:hypothetical protein